MRVVIELKRGEVAEIVLNNLFKLTQLQDSFGMNMVALVDGQPRLLNLKQFLEYFLQHRREVVVRRTRFELRKARERGHILEGLAVALSNVDEIIALIKAVADAAGGEGGADGAGSGARRWSRRCCSAPPPTPRGPTACRRSSAGRRAQPPGYRLSDAQAQAILELRLQRLTGLEQDKIIGEYSDVMAQIVDLLDILAQARARHRRSSRDELTAIRDQFGDARRSEIVAQGVDLSLEDLIAPRGHGGDAVARRLHEGAAGRRVPRAEARRPRQAGDGDQGRRFHRPPVHRQHARLHPVLLQPRPRLLAQGLQRAAGLARVARQADRQPGAAASRTRRSPRSCRSRSSPTTQFVFMATAMGTVKKTPLSEFSRPRPSGIIAVDLADGDSLIGVALTDGTHDVMLFSSGGKAVRFDENDVRPMGRNAHGVRGMMLDKRPARDLDAGRRGRGAVGADRDRERLRQAHADRRVHAPRPRHQGHDRDPADASATAQVVAAALVRPDDEVMLISTGGVLIRTKVKSIREMSRSTQGVTLINLGDGEKLAGLERVVETDDDGDERA